ncbi:type VI secretion system Vgr family protein [Ruegeria jejuensis]|uniref:type VI secretion system Vgr family protein n=1 Tax=Ruegeria jejuensis TaxID=3233338 RepID=UPI00355C4084
MNASSDFVQAERILRIDGLLGADELLAERLVLNEGVSALFEGTLQLRSKRDDLAPDQIVGKLADVSLELGNGTRRVWNSLVTNMTMGPKVTRGLQSYRLTLRPQMWLLSQRSDCRSWLDKSSVEVCEMLLSEHGLPAPVTSGIVAPPEPQHYSVQYNETDLAYLTRRLEEDGVFYWFEHKTGEHVLHIASHVAGYTGGERVRFAHGSTDRNHINRFETSFSYTPGLRTARDWNFQTPGMVPEGGSPSLVNLPKNGSYELYEFQTVGGYGTGRASDAIDNAAMERQMKLRMQASEADHRRVDGASNTRTLRAGAKFTPYDVANPENVFDEHVVLAIEHEATDASYETGGGQPDYQNRFLALPADVPATPHRATPRPRIDGTQVAVVAGPPGEEIHPDEYGRIKLWFPWDRRAKKDGGDTAWVRVMQSWAGAGWGGQVIPRIGMEVMVTYLDGDPDRPVVTGVVPNQRQKVPYELPEHKTKSIMRSNTHKGDGFNEITFEDQNGIENMFFHAQRDQTTRVLNDRTKRVDRHEVAAIGANRAVEVGGNQKHEIGRSMNTVVGGTGTSAFALMSAVSGMAGHTAGLLKQAGDVAGGGGPALSAFAGTLASSALGFLGAGGLASRSGLVGGDSNRPDAGRALGDAGSGVGNAAAGLFPMPGVMNTIVGSFKSDTIGIARAEQIGTSKVTNVGSTSLESVGKYKKIAVGEEFVIECGDSKFIMKSNGEVLILGKTFNFVATDHFQMRGKPIDMN